MNYNRKDVPHLIFKAIFMSTNIKKLWVYSFLSIENISLPLLQTTFFFPSLGKTQSCRNKLQLLHKFIFFTLIGSSQTFQLFGFV